MGWGGVGWDLGMGGLKSLQSNISVHILDTVLYQFPIVLTRRICLTIMSYVRQLAIISFTPVTLMFNTDAMLWEKLDCHS